MAHPRVMIASDGIPYENGRSHPRSAGCFSRVLALYCREKGVLTLMQALRKMTLQPALRLERACAGFRSKGRIQPGCDADITVFGWVGGDSDGSEATPGVVPIQDNATFADSMRPSTGIAHVLVGGTFVLRDYSFVDGVFPGKPMRGTATPVPGAAGSGADAGASGEPARKRTKTARVRGDLPKTIELSPPK